MNRKEFDLSGITTWHELGYTGKGIRISDKIVRLHSGNADNAASCTITDTGFVLNWTKTVNDLPEDTILMKIDIM